ncbi:MAG TPA: magnesium transporter [Armatimonadetes bacterium]|jgi:magnesium transporter|nr:magnesium transporter [Armatimonadota bacterium]
MPHRTQQQRRNGTGVQTVVQHRPRRAHEPEKVAAAIRGALDSGVPALLQKLISSYHPMDIALAMRDLNREQREAVFELLSPAASGIVLEEVDDDVTVELAEATEEGELAEIIDTMPPDVGADVMNLLDQEQVHRILEHIPDEESDEIEDLARYAPDTAGGIMTSEVIFAPMDLTARDVISHIRTRQIPPESLLYIYVVDDERRLRGAIDMADLVLARPDQPLPDFMTADVISVTADTDQEQAAKIVDQYDLSALPVVDDTGRLVGQVTVDDIIDAIQEEHTEDLARMAGTSPRDVLSASSMQVAALRLPWLAICFGGTLVSAMVIKSFTELLTAFVQLAAFIPVIAATSGNAGLQSAAIMVRSLSLGHQQQAKVGRVVMRQLGAALVMATIVGVVAGIAGHLIMGAPQMGLVVAIGMFFAVTWGTTMGAVVPILFDRVGIDPAVASGPLVSTINDVVSLLVYLSLGSVLLRTWVP